jgi:hypothetical protein
MTLPDRIIFKAGNFLDSDSIAWAFLDSARPEYLFSRDLFELVPSVHSDIARPDCTHSGSTVEQGSHIFELAGSRRW